MSLVDLMACINLYEIAWLLRKSRDSEHYYLSESLPWHFSYQCAEEQAASKISFFSALHDAAQASFVGPIINIPSQRPAFVISMQEFSDIQSGHTSAKAFDTAPAIFLLVVFASQDPTA